MKTSLITLVVIIILLLILCVFGFFAFISVLNLCLTLLLGYYCYTLHETIYQLKIITLPQIQDVLNQYNRNFIKISSIIKQLERNLKMIRKQKSE
jgi:hypothetical protein